MSSENDNAPTQLPADESEPSFLPDLLQRLKLDRKEESLPLLSSLLEDLRHPTWYVRATAVHKLGQLGEQAPLEELLEALNDSHVSVRANAVQVLGTLGKRVPLERLSQVLLSDSEWQVRESVVFALEAQGRRAPEAPLLAALHDPDGAVRLAALQVLQQIHSELPDPSISTIQEEQASSQRTASASDQQRTHLIANRQHTTHSIIKKEENMQENHLSTETTSYTNDKNLLRDQTRRPKKRLWRVVGLSIAAAVVIINVLAWSLLAHNMQRGTQTGSPASNSPTAPIRVDPTSSAGPLGKTLFVFPGSSLPEGDNFSSAGWSSDGKYVSLTSLEVVLLNALNGKVAKTFDNASASVWASWAPNGTQIVASSGVAQTWDVRTGKALVTFTPQSAQASTSTAHGNPMARLSGGNMIYSSAWSPNGRYIASAVDGVTYGYDVQIWNAATGAYMRTLTIKAGATASDYIDQVSWSPDGKYLAASSPNNGVFVWNTSTWQLVFAKNGVSELAWAPQGDLIASANGSMVEIWKAATGSVVASFEGQSAQQSIATLAWSPDGKYLAVAGQDVRVWDVAAKKMHSSYTGFGTHTSFAINSLAWAPDSIRLAATDTGIDSTAPHTGTTVDSLRAWVAV